MTVEFDDNKDDKELLRKDFGVVISCPFVEGGVCNDSCLNHATNSLVINILPDGLVTRNNKNMILSSWKAKLFRINPLLQKSALNCEKIKKN